MTKFLKQIVSFGLLMVLFLCLVEIGLRFHVKETFSPKFLKEENYYDIVIIGNSRANHHVNPQILDSIMGCNAINLGFDNCCADYQSARLLQFIGLTGNRYPGMILWNIDFISLGQSMGFESNYGFPYFLFPDSLSSKYDNSFFHYPTFVQRSVFLYYWKRQCEFPLMIEAGINNNTKGFYNSDIKWDGSSLDKIDTIAYLYNHLTEKIFVNTINNLKSHGTQVVFFYSPLYYKAIEKIPSINQMHRKFDSIASIFDIPILDYFDCDISHDTSYFYNAEHLNNKGARLFSKRLSAEIKKY